MTFHKLTDQKMYFSAWRVGGWGEGSLKRKGSFNYFVKWSRKIKIWANFIRYDKEKGSACASWVCTQKLSGVSPQNQGTGTRFELEGLLQIYFTIKHELFSKDSTELCNLDGVTWKIYMFWICFSLVQTEPPSFCCYAMLVTLVLHQWHRKKTNKLVMPTTKVRETATYENNRGKVIPVKSTSLFGFHSFTANSWGLPLFSPIKRIQSSS